MGLEAVPMTAAVSLISNYNYSDLKVSRTAAAAPARV